MSNEITRSKVVHALDWAYDKAIYGAPGVNGAEDMARDYLQLDGSLLEQVDRLIRWQTAKAATSGFVSGLGGLMLMPVALPANLASVMYIQVRMIAAIAYMGGCELRDDRVKTLVLACLCGNAAKDIVKEIGIHVGTRLTAQAIDKISSQAIVRVNEAVGYRLLTKFGQSGTAKLSKVVPLVGGVIGAAFDSTSTRIVGVVSRDTFIVGSGVR